jgi:LuxR family maltose regulon positive regulatory protein
MADDLLSSKLQVPPLRTPLIARDALLRRLDDPAGRVVLVSAPAGYGKTTLAGAWLREGRQPCAWVCLDMGDQDPERFLRYLDAALRPILGEPDQPGDLMVSLLNRAASVEGSFSLILDDYQLADSPGVQALLTTLIEHQPAAMRLMILTRRDPHGLPLPRLRARNELIELRVDDLRFSSAESAQFSRGCLGSALTANDLQVLDEQLCGWAAGLQLVAPVLQTPVTAESVRALAGSDGPVGEYFQAEVLDPLDPPTRELLLRAAILDEIRPELVDALQGSSGGLVSLHGLAHSNLFLSPVAGQRRLYSLHPMLRQFLREQLWLELDAEQIRLLYERAGTWFAGQGRVAEGVRYALMGEHYSLAADLLETNGEDLLWKQGEVMLLRGQLAAFPDAFLSERPELALLFARVLLICGETDAAARHLRLAENKIDAGLLTVGLQASLQATQAILMRQTGELGRSMELSRQGLDEANELLRALHQFNLGVAQLKSGNLSAAGMALSESLRRSEATGNLILNLLCLYWLAWIDFEQGRLDSARWLVEEGLRLGEEHGEAALPFCGLLRSGYAELLYEDNQLDRSQEQFERCLEIGNRFGLHSISASGFAGLGRLALLRGDEVGGREMLQHARRLAAARTSEAEARRMEVLVVNALLRNNDLTQAARWVKTSGLKLDDAVPTTESFFGYCVLARYWIAYSRARKDVAGMPAVIDLLERMRATASASESTSLVLRAQILLALAHETANQRSASMSALRQALQLSAETGHVRTFLEEGNPMLTLLREAAAAGLEPEMAQELLNAANIGPVSNAYGLSSLRIQHPHDTLTERESEVLLLIASGLSNEEIATHLVVTVNTVRTHIKSINRKFGVRSRTQAIYQAQRLGLLAAR